MEDQILSARPFVSSTVHQHTAGQENTEQTTLSSQLFNYDKIGGLCMKRVEIPKCSTDDDVACTDKIKADSMHFIASLHIIASLLEHRNKKRKQNMDVL